MLIITQQRKKMLNRLLRGGVPLSESTCVCNRLVRAGIAQWASDDVLRLTTDGRKKVEAMVLATKRYFAEAQRESRKRRGKK